jgi:hypothetical protein
MQRRSQQFADIGFEDFRRMATDPALSVYEKVGFPPSYRKNKEGAIFADILMKLPALQAHHKVLLDVGIGCSGLAQRIVQHCRKKHHTLIAVDSEEMLAHLPTARWLRKMPGRFPHIASLSAWKERVDAINVYSVLHYVFAEGNLFEFLDAAVCLLAPGGAILLGDIPNVSKRRRFFASPTGVAFHQRFMKTKETPQVHFARVEPAKIDDGVIFSILHRYREFGCDTYLLPQTDRLPMANRREDILICKP